MILLKRITSLFNPDRFQGWGKTKNYFEGWYFKILNSDETRAFAVIPGIAIDSAGKRHSFIQLLDGRKETSEYFKFDYAGFSSFPDRFLVSIDDNHFSQNFISLNLPAFKGRIEFSGTVPWPAPWYCPGIMGPYAFVPFMECYHGVVSMDHSLSGQLEVNGEIIDLTGGRGYIEKDWGRSFPEGYIWMQSNHFQEPGTSLKISVAKIPWLRNSFTGFIAGFWNGNKLIRFTTYNGSALKMLRADNKNVEIVIDNRDYRLEINAMRSSSTTLASPVQGLMDGRIMESMSATVDVNLYDKKTENLLFNGTGRNTALEAAGKVEELFTG